MANFNTTIERQTPPFTTRPGDTHNRVSTCNHHTARDAVDPSCQHVEDWNRRRDVRFGELNAPSHCCCFRQLLALYILQGWWLGDYEHLPCFSATVPIAYPGTSTN